MSGLVRQVMGTGGTAVDPISPGGVLIDPDEITQPGFPMPGAPAGHVLTADGLGGAVWSPNVGSANLAIQLHHGGGVPAGGTRFLRYGAQVITSLAGFRIPANGTLIGLTIQVETLSTNTYDLEILTDPASRSGPPTVIATLSLPASTLFAVDRTLSVAITAATDELGARVVRTSGTTAGLDNISVMAEFSL